MSDLKHKSILDQVTFYFAADMPTHSPNDKSGDIPIAWFVF